MLTPQEIDQALSLQLITGGEIFYITENIREQIVENFRKLNLVEEKEWSARQYKKELENIISDLREAIVLRDWELIELTLNCALKIIK